MTELARMQGPLERWLEHGGGQDGTRLRVQCAWKSG